MYPGHLLAKSLISRNLEKQRYKGSYLSDHPEIWQGSVSRRLISERYDHVNARSRSFAALCDLAIGRLTA